MLYYMSPSELQEQFNNPYGALGTGKLITEFKWYFAALMDHEDAFQLSSGQQNVVQFFGAYNADVEMRIENISRREDGLCVVLFSSDRGLHEITPLRTLRADVVLGVVSGIRVPKEAIHLDDDLNTFVFLQTSGQAERVDVEIIKTIGDSYIVRDGVEANTPLRVDSIIIVRARDLYHGKAVG